MRILVFGTYDATAHPRVATLAEGLRAAGHEVPECNAPLGLDTAGKVAMLAQPWRVPLLLGRLANRWWRLARLARRGPRPDAVLVGYLGHFDVHLARLLFRGRPIVLDHLIGASDTARDRRLDGGLRQRLLRGIDAAALAAADVIVVDTDEHRDTLPERHRDRAVVVAVGAPRAWFDAARPAGDVGTGPLRVVFFGLYTPLQGTPVIGAALARLAGPAGFAGPTGSAGPTGPTGPAGSAGPAVEVTMVGTGQDEAETKAAAGHAKVRWLDWVPSTDLPALVAAHDVCLGIFGTGPKALRVVPNKVFQGAAAGCAVVTSDTPPQRRELGEAALLVPPGDPDALAGALRRLAGDRAELARLRAAATRLAGDRFAARQVVAPLLVKLPHPTDTVLETR